MAFHEGHHEEQKLSWSGGTVNTSGFIQDVSFHSKHTGKDEESECRNTHNVVYKALWATLSI